MTLIRVPIFISSTFRDMHAERDFLRTVVFPELDERLRDRGCFLDPVDLRWGIDAAPEDDQESEEKKILRLCLDEIDQSRPFFLGLLGDRYGWIPDDTAMAGALDGTQLSLGEESESVTALEIRYGALLRSEQEHRSLILVRRLRSDGMNLADLSAFNDRAGGRNASADRLKRLKEQLRQAAPGRIRDYEATWDSGRRRVTGLEAFGEAVLEGLWELLEPETQNRVQKAGGWVARNDRAHETYVLESSAGFVGRDALLGQLFDYSGAVDAQVPILLTGDPGCGKSALLAQLVRKVSAELPHVRILYHSTAVAPDSQDPERFLRAWEVALGAAQDQHDYAQAISENPRFTHEVSQCVLDLLEAKPEPVLIVVDGMDRLRELGETFLLNGIRDLPEHVRIVASCGLDVDEPDWAELRIPGLSPREAEAMLGSLLGRARKTLTPSVKDALLRRAIGTAEEDTVSPSWLKVAFDDLQSLGEDDFAALDSGVTSGVAGVDGLLMRRVAALPRTVEAIFEHRIRYIEVALGEEKVATLLKAITGERGAQSSIMLPGIFEHFGVRWCDMTAARARRLLGGWISMNPEDGGWMITSCAFRKACQGRYLGTAEQRGQWHGSLLNSGLVDNTWHANVAFDWPTPFEWACIYGNVLEVRDKVRKGADVNEYMGLGVPPIFAAAHWGSPDVVRELIQSGADVNVRDDWEGSTPLYYGFTGASTDYRVIFLLLEAGASLNPDADGSLLHLAAQTNDMMIVELVLDYGAHPFDCIGGQLASVSAAQKGHYEMANALVDLIVRAAGPQLRVLDESERSWFRAAARGDVETLRQLGQHVDPACVDACGETALHKASKLDDGDLIAGLLDLGVPTDVTDMTGASALFHLAGQGVGTNDAVPGLRLLLASGADPNVGQGYAKPLHVAYRSPGNTQLLLEAGADPTSLDGQQMTPLHWSVQRIHGGDREAAAREGVMRALLAHGPPELREMRDESGRQAIDWLAEAAGGMSPEALARLYALLDAS